MNQRRYSKKVGNAGEEFVQGVLRARGFILPERIATPVVIIPPDDHRLMQMGLRYVRFSEDVSGDHRAYLPGGHGVLVESKTYTNTDRLQHSKLRIGQPEKLTLHAQHDICVLLAWVSDLGVQLVRWPVPGFIKGTSLSLDEAQRLNIMDVKELKEMGGEK